MAYTEFDASENSIKVLKGIISKHDFPFTETIEQGGLFSIFKENEIFKGIKLNDYLSHLELKGVKAEKLFKDLLEKNDVPCLYIGQGPHGVEKSNVLKDKMKSRRPDFLVNLPDMGILFFDVKCRLRKGFPSNPKTYFQLFRTEIDGLINLHERLLVPVWIAFIDESCVSDEKNMLTEFFLTPISSIKKYYDSLKSNLTERENKLITSIRIPDELLYSVKDTFTFKVGMSNVNEELAINFAKSYKGLLRRIEDKIKECIRNQKVLKTQLSQTIIEETRQYAFKAEVDLILKTLIEEKVIEYEAYKPLALQGE